MSFFDRVNHDILMQRVGQTIRDKRVLRLIGRYLRAGVMIEGVVHDSAEGTPQGGPISPLFGQHLLGRAGPGIGTTRTEFQPVCGRLQCEHPYQIRMHVHQSLVKRVDTATVAVARGVRGRFAILAVAARLRCDRVRWR